MNEQFIPFDIAHKLGLLITVCLAVALPVVVRYAIEQRWHFKLGAWLSVLLIGHEILRIWLRVAIYDLPLRTHLPLHLCGAALLLSAFMLWRRKYLVYEVAYFWGLGGSIPALLTPDLQHAYPHPIFLTFFSGHGLVLTAVLYATVVYGWRPKLQSIAKAFGATVAYAALIYPLNIVLGTNYLYLAHKPLQPSLIDYLGPWPWYVASLSLITVVVCFLCYLPFPVAERWNRRRQAAKA
ncbi:MAG: TIGR02206 family membrane protein [Gammaproteobacteria bacterium]|nr:TIGR02206 family membrane protein [Gammaproteobacteria bacterium]